VLQKGRVMKKSLNVIMFIGFYLNCHNIIAVSAKNLYTGHHKISKSCKKPQPLMQAGHHANASDSNTKKMLEDLYHRYPRKYARVQPKRIEGDDFQ
jgi:hypothetical protein